MSSFTNPLVTEDLNDGTFKVVQSFTYFVGKEDSHISITVPEGFIFDCFSIPFFVRWLLPKVQKRGNQSAALHDWLYEWKGILPEGSFTGKGVYTREECDAIFKEALEVQNVNWIKRNTMHKAVRAGGWIPWNKKD